MAGSPPGLGHLFGPDPMDLLREQRDDLLAVMVAFTDEGGGLVEDLQAQAWSDEGDDTDKLAAVRAILHGDEWVAAVDAGRAAIAAAKEGESD